MIGVESTWTRRLDSSSFTDCSARVVIAHDAHGVGYRWACGAMDGLSSASICPLDLKEGDRGLQCLGLNFAFHVNSVFLSSP